MFAEGEVEALPEQLFRQRSFSPKTVNDPCLSGTDCLFHRDQFIPRPDAVQDEREGMSLCERGRGMEYLQLYRQRGCGAFVQSRFTDGDNAGQGGLVVKLTELLFYIIYMARMNAGGTKGYRFLCGADEGVDDGDDVRIARCLVRMYIVVNHLSGDRVIAASTPWMAAEEAADGQIKSFHGTMFFEGFNGVFGAGRGESAGRQGQGGDAIPVEVERQQEQECEQPFHYSLSQSVCKAFTIAFSTSEKGGSVLLR